MHEYMLTQIETRDQFWKRAEEVSNKPEKDYKFVQPYRRGEK